MNQLILEDDGACPPQNCRKTLDFSAHERLALIHGFCQRSCVPQLAGKEEREVKRGAVN